MLNFNFSCFTSKCWGGVFCLTISVVASSLLAEAPAQRPPTVEPVVAAASNDAALQIQSFKKPEAWTCEVFAAEPNVANPVVLTVDNQGRVFVCESFRQNQGVTDNRNHDKKWLMADLASNTVADRIAYHRKLLEAEAANYEKHVDRIRILTDHDRDGLADESKVFVSGFNGIEEGTGAGILVRGQQVYYTCIPKLWLMEDKDFDGIADSQKVLADGFGVRVAFRGHDMHGLIMGPDGRVYFSIGDRGYHVETPNGLLADPESGAVFRCEPDGSQLEVVATGLRNPQELEFDDYGNWFTCDNNSDSGDEARWTVIVPGSDSGWRMMYQYFPDRGPFNQEDIWHPFNPESPAYIVPPIANFADGPSGLTYYPGTGLGDEYKGTFFLCDFRGQASNSGVRSTKLIAKGAFFEMKDEEQPIWNILATDIAFGPDGSLYVSDWVNGWNGEGKGRVYRFYDESARRSNDALTTHAILQRGMKQVSERGLCQWLAHPDRRVRLEAQWELASRGAINSLDEVASDSSASEMSRVHAIWGLGQIARRSTDSNDALQRLTALLVKTLDAQSPPKELFVALLTALGDAAERLDRIPNERKNVEGQIVELLGHSEPRVQVAAAMAAWRLHLDAALPATIALLEKNKDQDPILRHASIMAMTGIQDLDKIANLSTHPSESVRVAAVVALRKRNSDKLTVFLDDSSERVRLEATRALHDVPALHAGLGKLAATIEKPTQNEAILRRVLNAHFRLGTEQNMRALTSFAASSTRPTAMRMEALKMLQTWAKPGDLDRVMNRYAPLEPRQSLPVKEAVTAVLEKLLASESDIRKLARSVASELGIKAIIPELIKVIQDKNAPGIERAAALESVAQLEFAELPSMTKTLVEDLSPIVRVTATKILATIDSEAATLAAKKRTQSDVVFERQSAWDVLGSIQSPVIDAFLNEAAKRYLDGQLSQDCWLNVKEACQDRLSVELQKKLEQRELELFTKSAQEPTAPYADCAIGGDVAKGRVLFFERSQLSCLRCHEVGDDGGDVGPKLTEIGIKKSPDYLLEAIVAPNAKLAEGFETIIVQTDDGEVISGIVKSKEEGKMTILKSDGVLVSIDEESIEQTKKGLSSMPNDLLKYLNRRELRDLVAYLASLDGKATPTKNAKKPKGHKAK
ncbi:MAG: PVC-type heme-binding CxxCH protein [Pirellulaceae bacterium]|nr:PVC-type heme-binding CxxCH protein [Pirellulaceae bacterium]